MEERTSNLVLLGVFGVLLVFGTLYFLSAPPSEQEPSLTNPIEIGVILPLTGDSASYGTAMKLAYELAASEINSAGGIEGQEIALVFEDGKCAAPSATTAAQKLINIREVEVILGGACSSETLAAAELTQTARVLLLSPSATSVEITNAGDLVYRTYPSDDQEVHLFTSYADDVLDLEKGAILSEKSEFAQTLRKSFVAEWNARAHEVVFDEPFEIEETNLRSLVSSLKSTRPEFIYVIPQTAANGEAILKELRAQRVNGQVFGANSFLDRALLQEEEAAYEGMIVAEVLLRWEHPQTEAFLTAFEARYGEVPELPAFSASAYDGLQLVASAMRAGNRDAASISAHLNANAKDYQGALGTFSFDAFGDVILDLTLGRILSGVVVPIE